MGPLLARGDLQTDKTKRGPRRLPERNGSWAEKVEEGKGAEAASNCKSRGPKTRGGGYSDSRDKGQEQQSPLPTKGILASSYTLLASSLPAGALTLREELSPAGYSRTLSWPSRGPSIPSPPH